MSALTVRIASAVFAAAMVASVATETAFAQGSTVGPAGGLPSTTAGSNSQGTPAGGTGTLGTTRVGPGAPITAPAPSAGAVGNSPTAVTPATPPVTTTRRVRRARRPVRHVRHTAPATSAAPE